MRVITKLKKGIKTQKKKTIRGYLMWYIKNNGSKIITSYHINLRF